MSKAGFIGYGNMGQALAAGMRKALPDWNIGVFDIDKTKTAQASKNCGATVFDSYSSLSEFSDIVILAVKPQYLNEVAEKTEGVFAGKRIISLLAGTKIERVKKAFETDQVIRFMPNIAAGIGKAMTAVALGENIHSDFESKALAIADGCGSSVILGEELFGAFTGLSGSGIAYIFQIIHAFALGGTKCGIPYDKSLAIAIETIEGAAGLLRSTKENPVSSLSRVISPAGTTIEGINVLEEMGLTPAIIAAVEAAALRAAELEK